MADNNQMEDAVRYSVQSPRPQYFAAGLTSYGWLGEYAHALPSIYDLRRQSILAKIAKHPQNGIWQGATSGLSRDVAGAPWEITGKRRVKFYQDILLNANKGAGWANFIQTLLDNYHNSDDGAVMEIIGRGDPSSPLEREQVVGIATLDVYRSWFTGNPEYPVWYQDAQTGKLHKLHQTRVYRFTDTPNSDPLLNGRGWCALSRAWTFVQQSIVQNTFVGESLSNTPPPGILLVNGVVQANWEDAWKKYVAALQQKGATTYLPIVEYIHPDTTVKVTIEFIRFSVQPEGFDVVKGIEIQTKGVALGLNVDPQDVWPISGGSFGTNTQARVLDKKSKGRAIGFIMAMISRALNDRVLPDPLKFESKYRDTEQSKEQAEIAQSHVAVAKEVATLAGGEQGREIALRYLAKTVDSLADVLLDEDGELITLYDDDPQEDVPEPEVTVEDNSGSVDQADPETQTQDSEQGTAVGAAARKDFEDTRTAFERDLFSAQEALNDSDINRRRAGTVIRGLLAKHGRQAYRDGLKEGGVESDVLDESALDDYNRWLADQSAYVSALTERISTNGYSEAQIEQSVTMWANKALRDVYLMGLASADANGMYEWVLGATEHCDDCLRLSGQKHRMRGWLNSGWIPGSSKLSCGGYNCKCGLKRTKGRERGEY
jgi:hypothetical protein